MPDGTTDNCGPCRGQRRNHERWIADQDLATKRDAQQRARAEATQRAQAATAKARAIAACTLCDDDGYQGTTVCNHNPNQLDTNRAGLAAVRAALNHQTVPAAPEDDDPPF